MCRPFESCIELSFKKKNLNVGAVEEICYALEKAGAYYYEYVLDLLIERGIKKEEFKDNVRIRG